VSWRPTGVKDWIHFLVHAALPLVIAAFGVVLVRTILEDTPTNCTYRVAYLPAPWLVAAGIGALILGRLLSLLNAPVPFATSLRADRVSGLVAALGWLSLMVMLTGILFYEAIGTAHVSVTPLGSAEYEPITYYVRCAIYEDRASNGVGWVTLLVVSIVCFLVGHWLWALHPGLRAIAIRPAEETSIE